MPMNRWWWLLTFPLLACCGPGDELLRAPDVRIVRDDYGVPHIYADSVFGLFYGYGYSVGQDRLFQMEMARRSTQGMVAEVLGRAYLDFDRMTRQGFDPSSIRRQLDDLPPQDLEIFSGYAAGMNAWIDAVDGDPKQLLPREFTHFGFGPSKWTAYDVAMVFVGTMANRYGDFNTELENARILELLARQHGEATARKIFDQLNPRTSQGAPTTIPAEDWPGVGAKPLRPTAQAAGLGFDPAKTPVISGMSNCFVLGRDKAAGANAILVNGPQFGWFNPAYVYSVGLHGAGFNVVGNTPFAYPILLFAHNGHIAWGSTWGAGDIVDIYAEPIDPENPNRYLNRGSYLEFERRTETIQVKDAPAESVTLLRSVHGPIIATDTANGVAYAKHRSWEGKELSTLLGWVRSMQAANFDDWLVQAERAALNINWYYADVRGNIGYAFVGHYPERLANHDNRLPADSEMAWRGIQPFAANPKILNPSGGYLANWNNKPAEGVLNPDEYWYSWSRADRVHYLEDAISSQDSFTPEQAWDLIELSSYADLHAVYLVPLLEKAAAGSAVPGVESALQMLWDWDHQSRDRDSDGFFDEPATTLLRTYLSNLNEAVLADDLGEAYEFYAASGYGTPGSPTAAGTNLQTGTKATLEAFIGDDQSYDFLNGQNPDTVLRDVFETTVTELRASFGTDTGQWRLPVPQRPFLAKNFLGIPQARPEDQLTTPLEQNRGTENNMFVLKDSGIVGYEAVPPGQSGFIAPDGSKSPHYEDQLDLYLNFGKKRMWFTDGEVAANMKSEVFLRSR